MGLCNTICRDGNTSEGGLFLTFLQQDAQRRLLLCSGKEASAWRHLRQCSRQSPDGFCKCIDPKAICRYVLAV